MNDSQQNVLDCRHYSWETGSRAIWSLWISLSFFASNFLMILLSVFASGMLLFFGILIGSATWGFARAILSRKSRPRRGEHPTLSKRDHTAKARALAFEDMYRNYANPAFDNHLTPEDLEDVLQALRPKMIEYMTNQQVEFHWSYFDRILQTGIEQAAAAFLSI